jgi:sugar-specific transcriptional regulator TrmB
MFVEEEDLHILTQIGFTKNQAKLYLALLKLGRTDGRTLAKNANSPRTVVYRTLDELQKMGLVEKEITSPYKFKATPVKEGLQILMVQKLQQYEENQQKTETFLLKYQNYKEEEQQEQQYKFITVEGKERIIQRMKLHHNTVQESAKILTNLQRWLQILHYCYDDYVKALARKVKYQVVIETRERKNIFPETVHTLLNKPNFELKLISSTLSTNLGIFDNKEAGFNFFASNSLAESPIILTNHPGFLSMCNDHFDKIWKSSKNITPQVRKSL